MTDEVADQPTISPGDPFLGRQLGKFLIEQKLGQGGMGAVYRALDTKLDRRVALKLLPPALAAQPEYRERFRREARRAGRLDHPNVVQVYEVDEVDGVHTIAMQLMSGGSLQDLLRAKGTLPPLEAARIAREAARGLARAHKEGIVHRDVKPANILIGAEGEVRLSDFGLVKDLAPASGDQPLTQSGAILGTPQYMAPEQCEGLVDIDHRADLYALGLVLYQALSGTLPAQGSTPLQIIHHRLRNDPPPLAEVAPHVPAALVEVVEALLVRDRGRRLASADELVARLETAMAAEAATAYPPPRVISASPKAETVPLASGGPERTERKVVQARPVSNPVPRRPSAPAKKGWSCWKLGCCLLALAVGGVLAVVFGTAVLVGIGANEQLGGAPAEVFQVGREVQVEGLEQVGVWGRTTRIRDFERTTLTTLAIELEPIPWDQGEQIEIELELEMVIPMSARRVAVRTADGLELIATWPGSGQLRRQLDGTLIVTFPYVDPRGGAEGTLLLRFLR